MRNILLNMMFASTVLYGSSIMAEDYPIFYDTENSVNQSVPEIEFPKQPAICEPGEDYEACIATYLEPYGTHIQGSVNAQRQPSPIYSWEAGKCVLGTDEVAIEQCNEYEAQWQDWNERAMSASLDFAPDQSGSICHANYDPWIMRYVYKCQTVE